MLRVALLLVTLAALASGAGGAAARHAACPGDPRLGKVAYVRGGALHLLDLGSCLDRVLAAHGASGPVRFVRGGRLVEYGNRWAVPVAGGRARRVAVPAGLPSPNGRLIARVRVERRSRAPVGSQAIWVVEPGDGGRAVYTVRESYRTIPAGSPGPLGLVGWSPDSRWLLFYIDPMGSASIAADGLELQAVGVSGGRPRPVAGMLLYPDYMTWCGGKLVLTAGGSRLATENKWLAVATPPTWRALPLIRPRGRAWGSVACAPDGRKLAVQSQPVSHDYNFFRTRWSLWLVRLDGSRLRLTEPPPGYADESPRWSRDGSSLLFVRSRRGVGRVYLRRAGRVLGPLADLGFSLGYYGHHDWWSAADWWQPRVR